MKYLPFIISLFIGYSSFGQRGPIKQIVKDPIFSDTRDQINDPLANARHIYPIRETDVFWTKEVLRSIDLSAQPNNQLLHIKTAKDTNQTITSILQQALTDDKIQAFANAHDKVALNQGDAIQLLAGIDTIAIKKIFLLESWQFDPSIKKMISRIVSIAPCRFENKDTSHYKEIFWFKYIALRPIFEQDYITDMTVRDFFENRLFTSKILNISTADTVYYKK